MLYEVVLKSVYQGEDCFNRWNYEGFGTPAAVTPSFGLVFALGAVEDGGIYPVDRLMNLLSVPISSSVTFVDILVKAIYDPADFYASPFVEPLIGKIDGDGLPAFNAFGFRTNRVRRDIRRATKRIVGVPEGNQAGGVVGAGTLTQLDTIAAEMSRTLTYNDEGNTLTFVPTIVHKQRYNPDTGLPADDGRAYRYYPTPEEQAPWLAQGFEWSPYPDVRSQSSRQHGHGG